MDTTQWMIAAMSAAEKGLDLVDKHFAAVLGVAGTLIGAWLANRHAMKTQERALAHAEKQQKWAKQSQLRTETYMRASGSSARLLQHVISLADPNTDPSKFQDLMRDVGADFAALNVPASAAALDAAKAFLLSLFDLQAKLTIERNQMTVALAVAVTHRDRAAAALARQSHYTELLRQHNIGGQFDPNLGQRLKQQFDIACAEWEKHHQLEQQLTSEAYKESARLMALVAADFPVIARRSDDVLLALRKDLHLDIDEQAYRQLSQDGLMRSLAQFEQMQKKMLEIVS